MIASLMRAYTMNPGLERSGLGSEMLKMVVGGQLGPAMQEGGGKPVPSGISRGPVGDQNLEQQGLSPAEAVSIDSLSPELNQMPATGEVIGKKTPRDIESIANQYVGEYRPDLVNPDSQYGAIATFDSEIKQDLSPEEEGRLRQELYSKYKNPSIVDPVIARVREGIKNRYNEALAKYGFDKERRSQIQEKWNNFTQGTEERLAPHLSKYGDQFPKTKEVLTNKYNQLAASSPVNMTPQQMHAEAMAKLEGDIQKLDALHARPSMPPVRTQRGVADYIDRNKDAYKQLYDLGFGDALKEDAIYNKDMGNEEYHAMIWGDQTNKQLLNDLYKYKAPEEYRQMPGVPVPRYNKNYSQEYDKYINELGQTLRKLKPEDDLVLARAIVLDRGGTIDDFQKGLRQAQENGLELSPFQQQQIQEIGIPRVPPLWELFSEGGPEMDVPLIGKAKFLNWGPFINYIRGKK